LDWGERLIRSIRRRRAKSIADPGASAGPERLVRSDFLIGTLILFLLGAAVRAAYAFPSHKFAADADSLNMALRALAIRGGDLIVFFSGHQIGAFEAYLHAAAFAVLGTSRETVSLAPLVAGCLVLVVFFQFLRELFSTEVAFLALPFMALPSPAYLAWTYMPNSYPETVLFCVTTLWLAARAARRGGGAWSGFAIGVSAGLGWWNSALTLSCTVPALAWLIFFRREGVARGRLALGAVAGFALGAAPWILFNLRYGMPTLRQNFAAAPASGSVFATARRLVTKTVPELLVGLNPLGPPQPVTRLQAFLRLPAAAVDLLALALLPAAHALPDVRSGSRKGLLLLELVAITVVGLFVFSGPGQVEGPTVRYVLPLYFVVAASLGLLVLGAGRTSRWLAGLAAGIVLAFHLSGYYWPGTAERIFWTENERHDEALLRFLESERVAWVCGEYWAVYPLNFLSRERIRAVPYEAPYDFYGYGRKLSAHAGRVALLASRREDLADWVSRTGLSGSIVSAAPGYFAFLPAVNPPPGSSQRLLVILRTSAGWPPFAARSSPGHRPTDSTGKRLSQESRHPGSLPARDHGEIAGNHSRLDEDALDGGEQTDHRDVLLVRGVEVMDDVLQQQIQNRAAIVDALEDLKVPTHFREDEVRPDRLRRIRHVPVLDRHPAILGLDLSGRGVTPPERRKSGEQLPDEGELQVGELKLAGPDEFVRQEEAAGTQGARDLRHQ
jgi:hypothetical protein